MRQKIKYMHSILLHEGVNELHLCHSYHNVSAQDTDGFVLELMTEDDVLLSNLGIILHPPVHHTQMLGLRKWMTFCPLI